MTATSELNQVNEREVNVTELKEPARRLRPDSDQAATPQASHGTERKSKSDIKAARALIERRITVIDSTPDMLTLWCRSAHSSRAYETVVGRDERGTLRSCTCANGAVHPVHPRCWHVKAAELLGGER